MTTKDHKAAERRRKQQLEKVLKQKRPRNETQENLDRERDKLTVQEFMKIKPIKMALDTSRDAKKLQRVLMDLRDNQELLIKACQAQTRLTATELIARPTYEEELQNIQANMFKAVVQNQDGTFSDVGSLHSASQRSPHQKAALTRDKSGVPASDDHLEDIKESEADRTEDVNDSGNEDLKEKKAK